MKLLYRLSLVSSLSHFKKQQNTTHSSPHQPREPPAPDRQGRQHLQRERLRLDRVPLRRRPGPLPPLLAQQEDVGAAAARGLADAQGRPEGGVEGGGVEVGPAEELGVAVEMCFLGERGERDKKEKRRRKSVRGKKGQR